MIVQTVVSHTLYQLNKKKNYGTSYSSLETAWDKIINRDLELLESVSSYEVNTKNKLTISSVCLITKLPKETVRRKVNQLCSNNLLKISKREGITLGTSYKKVFQNFVPGTTLEVSKLIKLWEKSGVLKGLLSFRI